MRLNSEKREMEGNLSGETFKIQASAKAFQVLSDRLYTNKIRAVVRELCTNAYDSHIEAGKKDLPFVVKLPNELEPSFYVEDYGVGMSERVIMELYSSYFSSDKTDSNDAVGAFGLGSKSPFAYVDMFSVRSRKEGWEGNFHCYLNEEGVPCIAKVSECETSESNGVKIEITVKSDDYYSFSNEAKEVLRPFEVKPNVVGQDIEIKSYDFALEGENWKMLSKESSRYTYNELTMIQGCVEYPVSYRDILYDDEFNKILKEILPDNESKKQLEDIYRRNKFVILFPIGKLDIAPSREALSLDKRTKMNIAKSLVNIYKELFSKTFKELFQDDLEIWDIFKNAGKIINEMNLNNEVMESYQYNGSSIRDALKIPDRHIGKINAYSYQEYSYNNKNKAVRLNDRKLESLEFLFYSSVKGELKVVYDDDPENQKSGLYKLKQHIREHEFSAIVIEDIELINHLGITDYENLSSFDYIRRPGGRSQRSASTNDRPGYFIYKYGNENLDLIRDGIQRDEFETISEYMRLKKRLFVTRHYKEWTSIDSNGVEHNYNPYEIKQLLRGLSLLGHDMNDTYIFVLTKLEYGMARVQNDKKWKPAILELQKMIKKIVNNEDFKEDIIKKAEYIAVDKFLSDPYCDSFKFTRSYVPQIVSKFPSILNESEVISKAYNRYNELQSLKIDDGSLREYKQYIDRVLQINRYKSDNNLQELHNKIESVITGNSLNIEALENKIYEKYPMLQIVRMNGQESIDKVYDYIKLVEST